MHARNTTQLDQPVPPNIVISSDHTAPPAHAIHNPQPTTHNPVPCLHTDHAGNARCHPGPPAYPFPPPTLYIGIHPRPLPFLPLSPATPHHGSKTGCYMFVPTHPPTHAPTHGAGMRDPITQIAAFPRCKQVARIHIVLRRAIAALAGCATTSTG